MIVASARLPHELAMFVMFDGSDMIVANSMTKVLIWSKLISTLSLGEGSFQFEEGVGLGFDEGASWVVLKRSLIFSM